MNLHYVSFFHTETFWTAMQTHPVRHHHLIYCYIKILQPLTSKDMLSIMTAVPSKKSVFI